MERGNFIALVDGVIARRTAMTRSLSGAAIHVEPFESVRELVANWPRAGLVLAHDDGSAVPAVVAHMATIEDWLPLVAFAESPRPRQIVDAVVGGAADYLAWPFGEAELAATLVIATARAEGIGLARLREARARSRLSRLTRREREILACVAAGLSSRMIGDRLSISPRTVEIHRANLLRKIGAQHTSEAIRLAVEAGLA